ncbi:hypothetical protein NPIL_415141 [Nephila pilipes]|uniref:Uncharacterized protein n=1 Tax=Nephila pilipes TaxID=299642 RepID=A0A8X6UGR2_NEPPI|nr:hypothetical protein NPIL_415141 [Nephila pilipes]
MSLTIQVDDKNRRAVGGIDPNMSGGIQDRIVAIVGGQVSETYSTSENKILLMKDHNRRREDYPEPLEPLMGIRAAAVSIMTK